MVLAVNTEKRLKVLVTAYACEPHRTSELATGWNTAEYVSRVHDLWILVNEEHRAPIEAELAQNPLPHVHWHFIDAPKWLQFWRRGERGRRIHYYMWQVAAYFAGRKLHQEIGFDLIHHATYASYWTPNYLALLDVPFVFGPVGGAESTPPAFRDSLSPRGRRFERIRDGVRGLADTFDPFVRLTVRRARVVLATSHETHDKVRAMGARDVRYLSDMVMTPGEVQAVERVADVGRGPTFRAVSAGRFLDWKGFHLALQAFARFHEQYPDSEYYVVGDGPQEAMLKQMAQDLGVADAVKFTGRIPREDVFNLLKSAHVLLHPSLHDTGGYVCTEAMILETPVICLKLGGPAILVTDACGIVVEAETPEQTVRDMAAGLLKLAQDRPLRDALGVAARERVFDQYYCETRVGIMDKIYRDAVAGVRIAL